MSNLPVISRSYLNSLTGKTVIVTLKRGMEYKGCLVSVDGYKNLQLSNVKQYINGRNEGNLRDVFITRNHILDVRGIEEE